MRPLCVNGFPVDGFPVNGFLHAYLLEQSLNWLFWLQVSTYTIQVCKLCYNFLATSGVFFLTVTIGYCPKFYESHMYSLKLGTTNLPPVFGILRILQGHSQLNDCENTHIPQCLD